MNSPLQHVRKFSVITIRVASNVNWRREMPNATGNVRRCFRQGWLSEEKQGVRCKITS